MGAVMISKSFAVMGALLLLSATAHAGSAPKELYGKSITVSWTEEREQKEPWDRHHKFVMRAGKFIIYVSGAGRAFTRFDYAGGRTEPSDQVATDNAAIPRVLNFQGRSLSIIMPLEGGARNIAITFDDNFGGCSARVLTGKPQGTAKLIAQSLNGGHRFEIFSVKTGPAACNIQDGNVFAQ
jgi:hypothetical protein